MRANLFHPVPSAARGVVAAAWLAACGPARSAPPPDGGTAALPAPRPPPEPAAADTSRPSPQGWPARAELEENSLSTATYGPKDPADCGLPPVPPGDGRATGLVFHACSPRSGPELSAVPARRVRVPPGADPMEAAVRAQLAGATHAEKTAGYHSNFGPGTARTPFTVRRLDGGLVVLDLHPSIRRQRMMFVSNAEAVQLVSSLGQFPGVRRVAILIGGQVLCRALEQC